MLGNFFATFFLVVYLGAACAHKDFWKRRCCWSFFGGDGFGFIMHEDGIIVYE